MSEYNDPIRIALIGFGFVGKTFHAPLIRSVPGLELSVISSRHPEKVSGRFAGGAGCGRS